ncbi:hypothetical protein [Bartonella tribocorum]|uniref:hypothetical protein n=1 Tax=Bartonella tribocorum TaxID=85701 RepID=UPI0015D53569|nr:hypothetical protein [Bartonella tribocorum]
MKDLCLVRVFCHGVGWAKRVGENALVNERVSGDEKGGKSVGTVMRGERNGE